MHTSRSRPLFAFGVLASGPLLFGAEAQGCSPTGPPGADSGGEAHVACVSPAGGPCGGNAIQPCACSPRLTCIPVDGGAPLGDLGGTYTATILIYWLRLLLGVPPVVETAGLTPLINGQGLGGWEGDMQLWSVKDGLLVGRSPGTWLCGRTAISVASSPAAAVSCMSSASAPCLPAPTTC